MGAAVAQAVMDRAEEQWVLGSRPSMDKTWQLSMLAVGRRHQKAPRAGSPSLGPHISAKLHILSHSVCVAFSS